MPTIVVCPDLRLRADQGLSRPDIAGSVSRTTGGNRRPSGERKTVSKDQAMTYLSMQRIRFSSQHGRESFEMRMADVRYHVTKIPGFISLSWWSHRHEPLWANQVSMWRDRAAVEAWMADSYHKAIIKWVIGSGAVIENAFTNFTLERTRLVRICPACGTASDTPYDPARERETMRAPCGGCGYHFPMTENTADSTALWREDYNPSSLVRASGA